MFLHLHMALFLDKVLTNMKVMIQFPRSKVDNQYMVCYFLNQIHAGHWPLRAWFLEIVINNQWCDMVWYRLCVIG